MTGPGSFFASRALRALEIGAWPLLLLVACSFEATPPGAERMGTYSFRALPTSRTCELDDVVANEFTFIATFSRDPDTADAYVTLKQYSRDAGWNGQTIESVTAATRSFGGGCAGCPMALEETLRVDLLSQSQSVASGNTCPDGPPPTANDDAGIRAPGPDKFGYDAVRACGVLSTSTRVTGPSPDGGLCPVVCSQCTLGYRLTGERQ